MKKFVLLSLALLLSASAFGEALDVRNFLRPYQYRSGALENRSNGAQILARHRVAVPRAVGLRLHFDHRPMGEGVYLRLTTPKDRRVVQLDDRQLKAYRYTTPYLNGSEVYVELVLVARARTNGITIGGVEAPSLLRTTESICGADDNRTASQAKVFARMMEVATGSGGCSGTLVGPRCMVSAGHCVDYLNIAQFNVPTSNDDGSPNFPKAEDQYPLEKVYGSEDAGPGRDWAVYRMQNNPITGKAPGRIQGMLKTTTRALAPGGEIRITGFGTDDGKDNVTQQTHTGKITRVAGTALNYDADTMPGNSGSSIVLEATQEIIGIHTHGGCSTTPGSANQGTALSLVPAFQEALRQCLADDARE